MRRSEVAQKLLKVKTDEEAWDGQIQEQEKALASVNQAIETLVTEEMCIRDRNMSWA